MNEEKIKEKIDKMIEDAEYNGKLLEEIRKEVDSLITGPLEKAKKEIKEIKEEMATKYDIEEIMKKFEEFKDEKMD